MNDEDLEKLFPNLKGGDYTITSPATVDYNCIAWAANDTENWWWPDPMYTAYWPPEVPRTLTVESFIKAYNILGYTVCDSDEYETEFEKIAIYVDSGGKPTHAARQKGVENWTSELGKSEDIEHKTLDGLKGFTYGTTIAVVLKRPKQQ